MTVRKKVAALISGRGSNMQALLEACRDASFPAEICGVLSNRADAGGLAVAADAGIATAIIDHRSYKDRQAFESAMHAQILDWQADLVACAGFMRVLTEFFVEKWQGRIINIHPSLLPLFKGLHTHQRALDAGVTIHGCSAHFVTAGVDDGPIILQAAVPVMPEDTADSLAARVLEAEHVIYPQALALVAAGRARLEGQRVRLDKGVYANDDALLPHIGS